MRRALAALFGLFALVGVLGLPRPTRAEPLTVTATPAANLTIVRLNPPPEEALSTRPTLRITFDRALDSEQNARGRVRLLGPDGAGVPLMVEIETDTLVVQPKYALHPNSTYVLVLDAALRAADGSTLGYERRFAYATQNALEVVQAFPAPDSTEVDPRTEITLVFDRPVVPLAAREGETPLPLRFEPDIPGQGRWVSTYIYTFTPAQDLRSGETYHVVLPATAIAALDGSTLTGDYAWSFRVTPLYVSVTVWDGPTDEAYPDTRLHLAFNRPMRTAEVEAALQIQPQTPGAAVPSLTFQWDEDGREATLTPQARYTRGAAYEVRLARTVHARDGGALEPQTLLTFQVAGPLRVKQTWPADGERLTRFQRWGQIFFNVPLDADSVAGRVRITPQLPDLEVDARDTTLFFGPLEPDTAYTVTLLPGIRDAYGETELTEPYTFSFTTGLPDASLRVFYPATPTLFPADGAQRFWIEYTHMETLSFEVRRVPTRDFLQALLQTGYGRLPCPANGEMVGQTTWEVAEESRTTTVLRPLDLTTLNDGQPLPPGAYCLRVVYSPALYGDTVLERPFAVVTDRLVLKAGPQSALVWVTDPATGQPRAQVSVTLYGTGEAWPYDHEAEVLRHGVRPTDQDGLARWPYQGHTPRFAVVDEDGRFGFVDADWGPPQVYDIPSLYAVWGEETLTRTAVLYTDRPLYRPGQTVYFKGLVRDQDDLRYSLPYDLTQVRARLYYEGQLLDEQTLPLSAWATFDGRFDLADAARPGLYSIEVGTLEPPTAEDDEPTFRSWGYAWFRVALYHKPVFQVTVEPQAEVVPVDQTVTARVQATYYAGDAVAHGDVTWWAEARASRFRPPARYADYRFDYIRDDFPWICWACEVSAPETSTERQHATTDAQGAFTFTLAPQALLTEWDPRQDVDLLLRVEVTDIGGHTAEGSATVQVVRSQVMLGLKAEGWLQRAGEPTRVHLVALDPAGQPLPQRTVQVQVLREQWNTVRRQTSTGRWRWESEMELVPVDAPAQVVTDAQGRAALIFTPPTGGLYRVVVTARDAAGRVREAGLRLWVVGQDALLWPYSDSARLPLFPDQETYRGGETAQVLVPPPFAGPGVALVTLERQHVLRAWLVDLDGGNTLLDVPLTDDMAPGVYLTVTALRPPGDETPADYRVGTLYLPVDLEARRLQVTVTPDREQAQPGEEVRLVVETRDAQGQPVAAEVSLALVDKALLALQPDTFDLLQALYPKQPLQVLTAVDLDGDAGQMDQRLEAEYEAVGEGMGGGGGKGADIFGIVAVRRNYRDTAYWRARVRTDAQGRAEVSVTLPDNMTTWVVTARALTKDTRAGQSRAEIRVTRPFFVRLHTPAFFTAGDRVTVQAVVHNTTATARTATVRLEVRGARLLDAAEQTVAVPARGQAAVRWTLDIPADGQRVDLTAYAQAGDLRDAATPELAFLPGNGLPVYAYTTVEAVGAAGMLAQEGQRTEVVRPPQEATAATLQLTVNGSLVADLAAAYRAPKEPRTNCVGPWAGYLAQVALGRQMWDLLQPDATPPLDWHAALARGVQHLSLQQDYSGGWAYCPDAYYVDPALSARVLAALLDARDAGAVVDAGVLERAAAYLEERLSGDWLKRHPWDADLAALAVLDLARLERPTAARELPRLLERPHLSLAGRALLLQAALRLQVDDPWRADLVRALRNGLVFSAQGAHWDTDPTAAWPWNNNLSLTALALDALLQADPTADYLHQVVRWLMTYRNDTRPALLRALLRWATVHDDATPDYAYTVTFNGQTAAQGRMTADNRSQPLRLTWGLDDMLPGQDNPLTVARGPGSGVLYYAASLSLTLPAADLAARDDGIGIQRVYVAPADPETPLTQARVGDIVQVRLTVYARHDQRQVVLTDYLPAGLEPLDPALYPAYRPERAFTWEDFWKHGWGLWYFAHREVLDDRVVFVADYLPRGVYTVVYYARVSVPGDFQVRPAEVFAAQEPDLRGRTSGALFTVTREK
ncbi:MAG: hypothetical protein GXO37_07655 [Chloroflexi bacterium]|nr:hypothetical protein [Chloroflexota bacterium]